MERKISAKRISSRNEPLVNFEGVLIPYSKRELLLNARAINRLVNGYKRGKIV